MISIRFVHCSSGDNQTLAGRLATVGLFDSIHMSNTKNQVADMNSKRKTEDRNSIAENSDKSAEALRSEAAKVDPLDENFEHTLRRAAIEKEKKRSKNPGMYL